MGAAVVGDGVGVRIVVAAATVIVAVEANDVGATVVVAVKTDTSAGVGLVTVGALIVADVVIPPTAVVVVLVGV